MYRDGFLNMLIRMILRIPVLLTTKIIKGRLLGFLFLACGGKKGQKQNLPPEKGDVYFILQF